MAPVEKSHAGDPSPKSPGAVLRAAREKAGLSRTQLAENLNWVSHFVAAVEEDRYEVFSSRVFATGYVRSYGRYLEVPEAHYLEAHRLIIAASSGALAREPLSQITPAKQVVSTGGYVGYIAGFAIAAVALILWWQQGSDETAASEEAPVTIGGVDEVFTATAEDTIEDFVPGIPVDDDAEPGELDEPEEVAEPSTAPLGVASKDLHFSFSAECWLEVRDASGDVVFANLRKAGDVSTVAGKPPFEILIGDADAVTLHYQGKLVEFSAAQGRKFARLSVGA